MPTYVNFVRVVENMPNLTNILKAKDIPTQILHKLAYRGYRDSSSAALSVHAMLENDELLLLYLLTRAPPRGSACCGTFSGSAARSRMATCATHSPPPYHELSPSTYRLAMVASVRQGFRQEHSGRHEPDMVGVPSKRKSNGKGLSALTLTLCRLFAQPFV